MNVLNFKFAKLESCAELAVFRVHSFLFNKAMPNYCRDQLIDVGRLPI